MKNKITINCHSSIRIESKKIIYFDPYKIEKQRKDADVVFITHSHYDHFDLSSINKIIKEDTVLVVPFCMKEEMLKNGFQEENIVTVLPQENYTICSIPVEVIASYNIDKVFHEKEKAWVGYIITLQDERIYVAGDTDITKENQEVFCDIALVPIGGTYTMDYKEASVLVNKIKPKVVIPTHYADIVGTLTDGIQFKKLLNKDIGCILLINEMEGKR